MKPVIIDIRDVILSKEAYNKETRAGSSHFLFTAYFFFWQPY